ncbi:MAG TPA: efflux RND transporter periplasmic adaptor subunit [Elusimicrobiota bacterium]|nr:efflux RND transporter periplasmic adaptor subunit [Elusimicrobiota bacterium]
MISPFLPKNPLFRRWGFVSLAGLILAALIGLREFKEAREAGRNADVLADSASSGRNVRAYRIRTEHIVGTIQRTGTIRAKAETNLQFGQSGRIQSFDAEVGEYIEGGRILARLDPQEAKNILSNAEIEYQKAAIQYFKDRTIDRLEYERAKTRYNQARFDADKTILKAPHSGYLVEKWNQAGEQIDATTVVGRLMDKSRVSIDMELSEDDIQYLKTGQTVEVTVDAVPDYKENGKVTTITPYLKGDTRTFLVKVQISKNSKESLNPGMFARCTIHRYEQKAALTIPPEAAAEVQGKQLRLFTIDEKNLVHSRWLSVLFMDDDRFEITGIEPGTLVVIQPDPDLGDTEQVHVVSVYDPDSESSTNPSEGTTSDNDDPHPLGQP